jgi:phosphoglycerol transferase
MGIKFSLRTVLRLLALVGTVTLIWCANNDRFFENWSVPVDYLEDCPLFFGHLEAKAEGDFKLFGSKELHRLGAPYPANWNDWPTPGKDITFVYGMLSRWIGLFAAANLAVLLAYITSALAFYAVCRLLRFRWEWSFAGAVLFAFAYLHAYRNLHHIVHTYSYTVPFVLLSCWLVAFSRRMHWRDWRPWVCLATALAVGVENPYNANIFGQLICLGMLVQLISRRRKFNFIVGSVSIGVMVLAFVASNLSTMVYSWSNGENYDCIHRSFYETELFALKPMELFMPPLTHRLSRLVEMASVYARDAYIKGELFSPYLGWVGIAALLWMLGEALVRLSKPRRVRNRFPAYLPVALWVGFYSIVGGGNCFFAFFLVPLFRGSNRFSIYISAIVLLFLVSRLSLLTRRWQPAKRYSLAGTILLVGLFDQLPRPVPPEETQAIGRLVAADHAFGQAMEAKLPAHAMVFQLPVMPFPESNPIGGVQSYDMLRPYLHTKTLHFSFGSDKGRPREDWMKEVEKLPAAQMVGALEKYGFAALYLNRKGFADQGQALLKQLADAGRLDQIDDDFHEQVCVFLHPSPAPQLPPAGNRALWRVTGYWAPLNSGAGGEVQLWAHANAGVEFFSPRRFGPCSYNFTCQLGSLHARQMTAELNGKEVWSGSIAAGTAVPLNLRLLANPGKNHVLFKSDVVEPPSKANPVPRGYVLLNLQINRTD